MEATWRSLSQLGPDHALARLRISPAAQRLSEKQELDTKQLVSPPLDTSTLAAHDFDVDARSGFMPPSPPVERLPSEWEAWEQALDDAMIAKLRVGDAADITPDETVRSQLWRERVAAMPILNIGMLRTSERHLRRVHLVLAWILHFYVHSHPPGSDHIIIPASITMPLLTVSRELALPPVLTYADTVLYNWKLASETSPDLKTVTSFTGTKDEDHFILTSAYIELAGVEALALMQKCFDEAFVADSIAIRRISSYLKKLASAIKKLTKLLEVMRDGCDPKVFYNEIRPWFRGEDSGKRRWVFLDDQGEEVYLEDHRELSGPSNGQSSLIHALDVFLGVDHAPRRPPGTSTEASTSPHQPSKAGGKPAGFLERMQTYMPRHHRAFINHLKATPRPIRGLVSLNSTNGVDGSPSSLAKSYDAAVSALKGLRDTHIRIATLYIVSQMPRRADMGAHASEESKSVAKGTGGSDLVPFLKSSRDDTTRTLLNPNTSQRQ